MSKTEVPIPSRSCGDQNSVELALESYYGRLRSHRIYELLADTEAVCKFMETHVFAVWDFQTLLKALQSHLTCVGVPWVPTPDTISRRLINEIVLSEESDEDPQGGYASHYEIYLRAMEECGSSTKPIRKFVKKIKLGNSVKQVLKENEIPRGVDSFVSTTMGIVGTKEVHKIAAAFAYGREEAVPLMFLELVQQLSKQSQGSWDTFLHYLERHIGLDSEEHGPQAKQLVQRLCGNDSNLWSESFESAKESLVARLSLWDQFAEGLLEFRKGGR